MFSHKNIKLSCVVSLNFLILSAIFSIRHLITLIMRQKVFLYYNKYQNNDNEVSAIYLNL